MVDGVRSIQDRLGGHCRIADQLFAEKGAVPEDGGKERASARVFRHRADRCAVIQSPGRVAPARQADFRAVRVARPRQSVRVKKCHYRLP